MAKQDKSFGAIVRNAFRIGMDEAKVRRERSAEAKERAAIRNLSTTEHLLREKLAEIAAANDVDSLREELAVEIEVWRELYDDWRTGRPR